MKSFSTLSFILALASHAQVQDNILESALKALHLNGPVNPDDDAIEVERTKQVDQVDVEIEVELPSKKESRKGAKYGDKQRSNQKDKCQCYGGQARKRGMKKSSRNGAGKRRSGRNPPSDGNTSDESESGNSSKYEKQIYHRNFRRNYQGDVGSRKMSKRQALGKINDSSDTDSSGDLPDKRSRMRKMPSKGRWEDASSSGSDGETSSSQDWDSDDSYSDSDGEMFDKSTRMRKPSSKKGHGDNADSDFDSSSDNDMLETRSRKYMVPSKSRMRKEGNKSSRQDRKRYDSDDSSSNKDSDDQRMPLSYDGFGNSIYRRSHGGARNFRRDFRQKRNFRHGFRQIRNFRRGYEGSGMYRGRDNERMRSRYDDVDDFEGSRRYSNTY